MKDYLGKRERKRNKAFQKGRCQMRNNKKRSAAKTYRLSEPRHLFGESRPVPRRTFPVGHVHSVEGGRKVENGNPVEAVTVAGELKVKLFRWTLLRVDIPSLTVQLHRPKNERIMIRRHGDQEA